MPNSLSLLRTYDDARKIIRAFARDDGLNFVIMIGPPGVGKTNSFIPLCPKAVLFQGGLSPVKFYCELFKNRDRPVVIDDVDDLFIAPTSVNLLKCLGQSDRKKRLMWQKASHVLREEGVPSQFETGSRLLIFANTMKRLEENMAAVLDRAHAYRFEPSAAEIHREVGKWFRDREIYEFAAKNLALIQTLSMRDYVKASDLKRAGLDWRTTLLESWHNDPKLARILSLLEQPLSPAERQEQFFREGLGAQATYKRWLAKANKINKSMPLAD